MAAARLASAECCLAAQWPNERPNAAARTAQEGWREGIRQCVAAVAVRHNAVHARAAAEDNGGRWQQACVTSIG